MSNQVLDSLSLPSEPPHIGNWFSSYAYESPVLSGIDDIQDSVQRNFSSEEDSQYPIKVQRASDSISHSSELSLPLGIKDCFSSFVPETPGLDDSDDFIVPESIDINFKERTSSRECDRDSNSQDKENSAENQTNEKSDGVNMAYKGITRCKSSAGDKKRVGQDVDSSDDLSLASEPPDIRNWFSSYTYESPKLDTVQDFILPDQEKEFDDKVYTSANNGCWKPQNLKNSLETRFINYQPVSKDQEAGETKNSILSNELSHEGVSQQIPYYSTMQNSSCRSPRLDTEINNSKRSGENLETTFPQEADRAESCITDLPICEGEKSCTTSIQRMDSAEESLKSENDVEPAHNVQPNNSSGTSLLKQKLSIREAGGTMDKENRRNDFGESGFISTRKSRNREMHEESPVLRPAVVQSPPLSGVTVSPNCHKHGSLARREVLAETTNLQNPSALGTTGKWRCPQKTKPHLGPPLKQLRLEQWVRRV